MTQGWKVTNLNAHNAAQIGAPPKSLWKPSKPDITGRGKWVMSQDTTLDSLVCSCGACTMGCVIGSALIALSDGIVSNEEIAAVTGCKMIGIDGARILSAAIVRRRYPFGMPEWVWKVQGDEDLEWVLTHYLFSSRVAYREAQETCEMYKGARRYRLEGKVTYHVPSSW